MKQFLVMVALAVSTSGMAFELKLQSPIGRAGVFLMGDLAQELYLKELQNAETATIAAEGGDTYRVHRIRKDNLFNCTEAVRHKDNGKEYWCAVTAPILKTVPNPKQLILKVGTGIHFTQIQMNSEPQPFIEGSTSYVGKESKVDAAFLEGDPAEALFEQHMEKVEPEVQRSSNSAEWTKTEGDIQCSKLKAAYDGERTRTEYFCSLEKVGTVEIQKIEDATTLTIVPGESFVLK